MIRSNLDVITKQDSEVFAILFISKELILISQGVVRN